MRAEFRHVSFAYGRPGADPGVLHDLSFAVEAGEFVCLLGPSGGGKSTLLRLLAGLERPDGGEVLLDGAPVSGPGLDRSIVFQEYLLFPWMTALKNVSFCVRRVSPGLTRAQAEEIARRRLEEVGLSGHLNAYPGRLSGGQRQRVAIARALAMEAGFLMFDEPFGAVDPRTRRMLQRLLEEVWRGERRRRSVLFVTHDINEAILLADRILFLGGGRLMGRLEVNLPRPRQPEMLSSAPALELQRKCLQLYSRCAVEDEGGAP